MDEASLVVDVTTELIGERREEWRAGHDSGLKQGTSRVLQSKALEQLALELTVHRAVSEVALQRERLIEHWKAEATWWKEEHDRVHDEYCATVRQLAARFAK